MAGSMPDLQKFFAAYEALAQEADAVFAYVRSQFPTEVICKEGCSSCCHALFDLSLIEALYLNRKFQEAVPDGVERFAVLNEADAVDRKLAKLKRQVFRESRGGKDNNEILQYMATVQVRCPLLGKDDLCIAYHIRPITCRLYGVPTAIGGKAHTCGKTGFVQGKPYPTVALDGMQQRLGKLSAELAQYLNTAYKELALMYVPVSTALITAYTAEYLGVGGVRPKDD